MFAPDRICAVIAAPTAAEVAYQVRKALKYTRLLEFRLDWLKDLGEFDLVGDWLMRQRILPCIIATCRRRASGGNFDGTMGEEIVRLALAGEMGCQWRDVALETARLFGGQQLRYWLGKGRVLVSFHNFRRTTRNLESIARRLDGLGGDAIKIATQCNSIEDSMRVLSLARGRKNVIAVPMGEFGLPARVLALREGSALAYAAVDQKTAPGQLTLDELKNLYRADTLNRKTRVYGVIGDPVAHSLSPLMHNRAFQQRKINAVYLPFLVKDLRDFLRAIKPLGIAGFSVTLPHKEKILSHLDDCDPLAEKIGAVNTVTVRSGTLYGCNTDYVGVLRALERRVRLRGSRVLIFGAGGVARAVAFALAQAGAIVAISARRPKEANKLARTVGAEVVPRARLRREFFDAIVNATPVGMHPHTNESPLRANELNCRLVFDTIYRPMKTRLLQLASRRGIETVSGAEMFIAQGVAQWEIWTERRAPVAIMRRAILDALRKEKLE